MKVSAALQGVALLFLDTAPVIYLVEKNPDYLAMVSEIFRRIDDGQVGAVTSPVTLAECLVHPFRLGLSQLRQDFIDVVAHGAGTTFVNLDQSIGETAGKLRAQYNLRLPDSLQIATAITSGCQAFLTNDSQLKRVTELQMLVLDDLDL